MNRGWTIPDQYRDRGSDLDECPECGGPKTKHGAMCIACRRRIGRAVRSEWDRFWEKVDVSSGVGSCWPWTGARDPNGYGRFAIGKDRSDKASRIAFRLVHGSIPGGLYVLHDCDNPPCCNPAHLYAGTQRQNVHDAMRRGRHKPPPRRS